jgi:hypothetical protein
MEHDHEKALNMELIICIFEQQSGSISGFYMSEIFVSLEKRCRGPILSSVMFILDTWESPYILES